MLLMLVQDLTSLEQARALDGLGQWAVKFGWTPVLCGAGAINFCEVVPDGSWTLVSKAIDPELISSSKALVWIETGLSSDFEGVIDRKSDTCRVLSIGDGSAGYDDSPSRIRLSWQSLATASRVFRLDHGTVVDHESIRTGQSVMVHLSGCELAMRHVFSVDEAWMLDIANEEQATKFSMYSHKISTVEHRSWFARVLSNNPKVLYLVGCDREGNRLGTVRFDKFDEDAIRVSVDVHVNHRGYGFAAKMLISGREFLLRHKRNWVRSPQLVAQIHRDNIASQRSFASAGYVLEKPDPESTIQSWIRNSWD